MNAALKKLKAMDGPGPAAEGVREEDGVERENRLQGGQEALFLDEEEEAARRTEEREVVRRIEGGKEGLLGEVMVVQWLPTYSELPRRRGVEEGSGLEVRSRYHELVNS